MIVLWSLPLTCDGILFSHRTSDIFLQLLHPHGVLFVISQVNLECVIPNELPCGSRIYGLLLNLERQINDVMRSPAQSGTVNAGHIVSQGLFIVEEINNALQFSVHI